MPEKLTTNSNLNQDSVTTESRNSSMVFNLTAEDKQLLRSKYDVVVFAHDCIPENIDKSQWPYNAVLVTYEIDGVIKRSCSRTQEQQSF